MRAIRFVLLFWIGLAANLAAQAPERFVIDPAASSMTIHVGKTGLLSFAGHEHEITAPVSEGTIVLDRSDLTRSSVSVRFDTAALKVTGRGEPPEDVPEVQRVMLSERVLDVQRYPTIEFQSRTITVPQRTGDQMTLRIAGDLTLHGVIRPVTVLVKLHLVADAFQAEGRAVVRQTAFGIRPVTAGAGTVRVKDEVEVVFAIAGRRR